MSDSGYGDDGGAGGRRSTASSSSSSGIPGKDEDESPSSPDNVSVIVRVRPFNSNEINKNEKRGIQFPGEGRILAESLQTTSGSKPKLFTYNVVLEPDATQKDVFEHSGVKQLVDMALDGYSSTVFAYGQTGSGKTFTLTGPPLVNGKLENNPTTDGLMLRCFQHLFEQLKSKPDLSCVMHASFLEIYNEQVIDLLNPGSQKKYLQVRWARNKGFYVENLFVIECVELDDVMAIMEEGLRNRQVAPNNLNENSSRSHCILTLNILSEIRISEDDSGFVTKRGKLSFVDLAGSEKAREGGPASANSNGGRAKSGDSLHETNKINRSLLTLGKCISALGESKKKQSHIPYRDSKLTKLLADSLGGNGVTLMIACVPHGRSYLAETINTLRYASRTKQIRNKPIVIMDPRETAILGLKREIKLLKAENQYLRQQLEFPKRTERRYPTIPKSTSLENLEKLREAAEKNERLPGEVNPKELYNMLKDYMVENEALREENSDLLRNRDLIIHDMETVCRENERLVKKAEDKDNRGIRSPKSIGAKGELKKSDNSSTEANVWVNENAQDLGTTFSGGSIIRNLRDAVSHEEVQSAPLPATVSRELRRRRTNNDGAKFTKHIRHRSWDSGAAPPRGGPMRTPPLATDVGKSKTKELSKSKSEQELAKVRKEAPKYPRSIKAPDKKRAGGRHQRSDF